VGSPKEEDVRAGAVSGGGAAILIGKSTMKDVGELDIPL
jgi:hypothetical protein